MSPPDPPSPPPVAAPLAREIPLAAIRWDPQPRTEFDEAALGELAESMKLRGQLSPIRVRSDGAGGYVGVFGERRFRAARRLGWVTIVAIVALGEPTAGERALEQLSENVFRDDLRPVERAAAYRRVMDGQGWTARELAAHLGVSPAKVSQDLRLLALPADVRAAVDGGRIPASTAVEIGKADPADRAELVRRVTEDGATRAAVKTAARAAGAARKRAGRKAPAPKPPAAFRFESPPAGDYGFVAAGNKIVVTGKKVASTEGLAEAARALVAVLERALAHHEPHERLASPATPVIAHSPPPGAVPAGSLPSERPKEEPS